MDTRTLSPAAEALLLAPEGSTPIDVVRRWHRAEGHAEPWSICTHRLCYSIRLIGG